MSKKRGKNRSQKRLPASSTIKMAAPARSAAAPKPMTPPANPAPKKPFLYKTAALAAVMLICVAVGAWFALSPTLEKNRMLEQQNALLDSIEQGDGEIVLDAALARG